MRFFGKVLRSSPGLWAATAASYCPSRAGELPKTFPKNLCMLGWETLWRTCLANLKCRKKHLSPQQEASREEEDGGGGDEQGPHQEPQVPHPQPRRRGTHGSRVSSCRHESKHSVVIVSDHFNSSFNIFTSGNTFTQLSRGHHSSSMVLLVARHWLTTSMRLGFSRAAATLSYGNRIQCCFSQTIQFHSFFMYNTYVLHKPDIKSPHIK